MTGPAAEPLPVDTPAESVVIGIDEVFTGRVWDLRTDHIRLPHGEEVSRDLVVHTGAVGVVALDEDDRVLLLRQYRHPVGMHLWEPPAGLLDVDGEPPHLTAARELAEEAGLQAQDWWLLTEWFNSPGGSTEAFRCYLARGLSPIPGGRPERDGEEYDMPMRWVQLDAVVDQILAGRLHNPLTVAGVLAAAAAKARNWTTLRAADAPWPAYQHLLESGRIRSTPPPA